jgi:hypothetical protein
MTEALEKVPVLRRRCSPSCLHSSLKIDSCWAVIGMDSISGMATHTSLQRWVCVWHSFSSPIVTDDQASVSMDNYNRIRMFDPVSGMRKTSISLSGNITRLVYLPETREIAFAGYKNLLGTCNPSTGEVKEPLSIDQDEVHQLHAVVTSADGGMMLYGNRGVEKKYWNLDHNIGNREV